MIFDKPEINTFVVQPHFKDRSQIFIFLNPPRHRGLEQSRIFLLAEISLTDYNLKNQLQLFITQLSKYYQEMEKESPLTAFENSLEWANQQIQENFDPKTQARLNLLFGCFKKDNLQFATGGNISAHVFFKEKGVYKNLDLLKTCAETEEKNSLFFSNLISGTLHANNFALFTTASVFDFLTLDRVQKIITNDKPANACNHLEKILNAIENKMAFGGLLIFWPERLPSPVSPVKNSRLTPDASIKQLLRQEQKTASIMSPALWSSFKELWSKYKGKPTAQKNPADLQTLKRITHLYARLTGWQGKIKKGWQNSLIFLGKSLYRVYLLIKKTRPGHFSFNLSLLKKTGQSLIIPLIKSWQNLKTRFWRIPPKRRLILIFLSLTLITLVVSLSINYYQNKNQLASQEYNQAVNKIKSKLDQAESSLIYKDETQARLLAREIKNLLDRLPHDSSNRQKMYERLFAGWRNIVAKLQHFLTVAPQTEIDLASYKNNFQANLFTKIDKKFIFINPLDSTILIINSLTKELKLVDSQIENVLDFVVEKDGTILLLGKNGRLARFDPSQNTIEPKEVVWPAKNFRPSLIGSYNSKLYALDTAVNQISKHLPSTTGFGKGAYWLSPEANLKLDDVVSLVIDGAVYLAKNNGEIWKLESGRKQDVDLGWIDPPLQANSKISTKTNSDNLFILGTQTKRIIILNKKTGRLISQLTSPDFSNPLNFSVDEKEKKIYVLDGGKVLSIKY